MKESKYAHSLDRCEVESVVNPLKDKEPTPAWKQKLNEVLKHYGVSFRKLSILAQESGRTSLIGNRYNMLSLKNSIANFMTRKGAQTWTRNAQQTINDHLDILIDYLSKPEDCIEHSTMEPLPGETWEQYVERVHPGTVLPDPDDRVSNPSLLERLEKLREERGGIFDPETNTYHMRIEDKPKTHNEEREEMGLKPIEDAVPECSPRKTTKVKVRKVQKHKTSKIINIIINI